MVEVREATSGEIDEVLGWTHPLWGGDQDLLAYRARTRMLLDGPWGQARYRFHVGVSDGQLVSACKAYDLDMAEDGRALKALGFGAVFTPEARRGAGHAGAMLRAVMAQHRAAGAAIALLFSDIGAPYYERLGFQTLTCGRGFAPAEAGPNDFRPATAAELAALPGWHEARPEPGLTFGRSRDFRDYLLARCGAVPFWAYAPGGGAARGYAITDLEDGRLILEEARGPTGDIAFWRALRHLAADQGATEVAGWMPPLAEAAGFTREPLRQLAMVASLNAAPLPTAATFWAIEHF